MNILKINFQELHQRHLCRHSQLGINVVHVVSVLGTYVALCGLFYALGAPEWMPLSLMVPYLAILAFNIPLRVLVLTVLFLGLVSLASLTLPRLPFWWYAVVIILLYKLQAWSHKVYTRETDMTEFDKKYQKGITLFVLLSIYELPILLSYLFFGKNDWYTWGGDRSGCFVQRTTSRFGEKAGVHANGNDSATV
jgi:hypothetical protein